MCVSVFKLSVPVAGQDQHGCLQNALICMEEIDAREQK